MEEELIERHYDGRIYQKLPQIVLGFHGCDEENVKRVLLSQEEHLYPSENEYDWLGDGVYFWLNDPQRAYEWACDAKKHHRSRVKKPAVIGAVIDLGACLNLCERESILLLQRSYSDLAESLKTAGLNIKDLQNKAPDEGGFALRRYLDCAVIRNLHKMMADQNISYDTVYGFFQEGDDAFQGAGIKEKSHIQIAVRNLQCIKGYFLPRT